MSILKKANNFAEIVFGYAGIVMIFIATYGVIARTILNISTPWVEEALKLLFVWSIFVCTGLSIIKGELISLDIINEKLANKPNILKFVKLLQNIFNFLFGFLCIVWSYDIISVQIITQESTTVLGIPLWIINSGFLLGSILLTLFPLYNLFKIAKSR